MSGLIYKSCGEGCCIHGETALAQVEERHQEAIKYFHSLDTGEFKEGDRIEFRDCPGTIVSASGDRCDFYVCLDNGWRSSGFLLDGTYRDHNGKVEKLKFISRNDPLFRRRDERRE